MVCLSETYLFDIENNVKACFDDKIYEIIHIRLLEYVKVDERAGAEGLCPWSRPMSRPMSQRVAESCLCHGNWYPSEGGYTLIIILRYSQKYLNGANFDLNVDLCEIIWKKQ